MRQLLKNVPHRNKLKEWLVMILLLIHLYIYIFPLTLFKKKNWLSFCILLSTILCLREADFVHTWHTELRIELSLKYFDKQSVKYKEKVLRGDKGENNQFYSSKWSCIIVKRSGSEGSEKNRYHRGYYIKKEPGNLYFPELLPLYISG